MTIYDVKQKAVDALGEIDPAKLTMMDLTSYVNALHQLHEIKEPDPTWADTMKSMTEQLHAGWANAPKPATLNDLK